MSKSLGNAITLGSSSKEISSAVKKMYTDPTHLRIEDPGQIEGNVVFTYLDAFHPDQDQVKELKAHYQRGGLGDGQVKKVLDICLQDLLEPIRTKRKELIEDRQYLIDVLKAGTEKANQEAEETLKTVKASLGLNIWTDR